MDGIDAALISVLPSNPPKLVATHSYPIPQATRAQIQALMNDGPGEIERLGELDMALGALFAEAVNVLVQKAGMTKNDIRAIGSHGQTLRHRPRAAHPFTLQIGNPSVIAEHTGITTVADFRARDMAAGGQGAPLVPAFHQAMFHSPERNRAIVNIGGIANVTYLPADKSKHVTGFDTGPGNTLLDQWIAQHHAHTHDESGNWAASGHSSNELLGLLLADPYFKDTPPKSTGREHFNMHWLQKNLKKLIDIQPVDVQATLLWLTARSIADSIRRFLPEAQEVYVCGGGAHNKALITALANSLPDMSLATTDKLGMSPDWVEAAAFAWLAHRTLERQPGNLPTVTGTKHAAILGGIYPA